MRETPLPMQFEELTPEWMTSAMREAGHLPSGAISAVRTQRFGEGVGLMGQIARLEVDYEGAPAGLARKFVVKLPSPYEANRQMCVDYRIYEKEHLFYRELAGRMPVRVPKAYYNVFDPADHSFVLILEDLAPAEVGDESAAMPDDKVRLAIRELARFHARWWETGEMRALDWIPYLNQPPWRAHKEFWGFGWAQFKEKRGDTVSPYVLECGDRMCEKVLDLQEMLSEPPCTIFHMDYRLSNMMFGTADGGPEFAMLDWQPFSRGKGLYDVGYFLSQSIPVEQRRRMEDELLHLYHETLTANGVGGYSFERLFQDYRLGIMYCLLYPMGTGMIDLSNDVGRAYADRITERSAAAIADHRTGDLIPV